MSDDRHEGRDAGERPNGKPLHPAIPSNKSSGRFLMIAALGLSAIVAGFVLYSMYRGIRWLP